MMKTIIRLRNVGVSLLLIVVLFAFVGAGTVQASPTSAPAYHTKSWKIVSSPNTSATYNVLNSVAAFSTHDAWAVGQAQYCPSPLDPLVEHWNGMAWSVVSSPNPTTNSFLSGAGEGSR